MAEGPEQQLQASARGGALILGSPLFCIFARFCFWYQPFFPRISRYELDSIIYYVDASLYRRIFEQRTIFKFLVIQVQANS